MLLILIRKHYRRHRVYGKLYIANSYHPYQPDMSHSKPTYELGAEIPDNSLIYLCDTMENRHHLSSEVYYHLGIPALKNRPITFGKREDNRSRLTNTRFCTQTLEDLVRGVMATGENVYLNITHYVPEYPDYPRINYDPRIDLRRAGDSAYHPEDEITAE